MEERVGYMEINGKEVFVIDFSCLGEEQFLQQVFFSIEKLADVNRSSYFLILVNDCELGKEVVSNLKIVGKTIQPFVIKSALVGLSSKSRPFFNIYVKFTRSKLKVFEHKEEAINYLLSS